MTTKTFVFALAMAMAMASTVFAQTPSWTSTDVGNVTLAGSANESDGVWTVNGDGSDIWGTADAFQFLSSPMAGAGNLTVRVLDLQNTNPFAKAGLMFRSDTTVDAATFLIDIKPDGGVELLARNSKGASMSYLGGTTVTLPAWLRIEHTLNGGTNAWVSQNGSDWQLLREEVPVQLGSSFVAGIAVTSHDPGQLNSAHFDHLNLDALEGGFFVTAVGDAKLGDGFGGPEWTLIGAGSDIWGTADSFEFAYHDVLADAHIVARVDDLQNTNPFAKAGVMLRSSLDPGAPTVILDLKPDGTIEFMARSAWGGEVSFLAGLFPPPALRWLDLSWQRTSDGTKAMVTATASADKVNWVSLGPPALIPWSYLLEAGIAVTSHDPDVRNTAHFSGVSLLPNGTVSDDIGVTGFIGGAVEGAFNARNDFATVVVGAGADIWGTSDSFEFVHGAADTTGNVHAMSSRVSSLSPTNPFAKAGMMFRDSLDPGAMHVILDVKPDGGIEFMARLCTGCETTFLGGATMTLPVNLTLFRDGTTYTASVVSGDRRTQVTIGSVDVTMASPIPGLAVTSHDPNNAASAVFDDPSR